MPRRRNLSIPDIPPSPSAIRKIDKALWDRKGIACTNTNSISCPPAAAKLDDFVYDRGPTDQIMERIEAYAASVTSTANDASARERRRGIRARAIVV